jgi:hypothetical protein|tara:strand:+ start:5330 stop:5728 length:399 start_codon:yes stop_codon:yes gene_type:complete
MESIKDIDIRHFKLTSGEELICYVQSSSEHAFIVERPAVVRCGSDGTWTFGDWFPFSDKKMFKIMKRFVINHTEVVDETKESFIKYSCQDIMAAEINDGYDQYDYDNDNTMVDTGDDEWNEEEPSIDEITIH